MIETNETLAKIRQDLIEQRDHYIKKLHEIQDCFTKFGIDESAFSTVDALNSVPSFQKKEVPVLYRPLYKKSDVIRNSIIEIGKSFDMDDLTDFINNKYGTDYDKQSISSGFHTLKYNNGIKVKVVDTIGKTKFYVAIDPGILEIQKIMEGNVGNIINIQDLKIKGYNIDKIQNVFRCPGDYGIDSVVSSKMGSSGLQFKISTKIKGGV